MNNNSNSIVLAKIFSDNPAADNIAAAIFDGRNKLIGSKAAVTIAKEEAEYPFYKDAQCQIYFYGDRVLYSDKCTTSVISYSHIIKAFETKDYFFLYVTERKMFAIPKKGFMFPDEMPTVVRLLEVNVKGNFKKEL
ncbi:MAG: YcxB family protein [Oscillospiraceae bacterium]|nr:YcxB family protein [Oscillospiraceae bacterium]